MMSLPLGWDERPPCDVTRLKKPSGLSPRTEEIIYKKKLWNLKKRYFYSHQNSTMRRKKSNKRSNRVSQRCGPKGAHEIVKGIFISGENFAMNEEKLQQNGIASIVACGCRAHFPEKFRYKELRLSDSATSNVGNCLHPAADFIAQSLRHGAVLVHCKAGICRSTTMIAAYLLKYSRDITPTVADALKLIRQSRPCANPRPEFIESLEQFSEQLYWLEEQRKRLEAEIWVFRRCEKFPALFFGGGFYALVAPGHVDFMTHELKHSLTQAQNLSEGFIPR